MRALRERPSGARDGRTGSLAAGFSLAGIVVGWMSMMTLLLVVILAGYALRSFPADLTGSVGFVGIFGLCSLVVCLAAWVLVAWPVTWTCWETLAAMPGGWSRHGLRGAVGGLAAGVLPGLWGAPPEALAWFAGLAILTGAVTGAWTGWKVRRHRLRREFEAQGWTGGRQ